MSSTPTRPGVPEDPELRDRYLRDADANREARRAEAARLAAEVPPAYTPKALIWIIAGILTVVMVLLAGFAILGPMLKQTSVSEQDLPATTSELVIDNSVGDVRVRVAEAGESPHVTGRTEWGLRRPDVSVDSSGGTTTLSAQCPEMILAKCSTEWTVVVPADVEVDVHQGVGELHVEGITGDIEVEAGVGDIELTELESQDIEVQLGVGGLSVESVEPPRSVEARVGVGDLNVRLPDTVEYDIETDAGAGEASNSLGSTPGADRTVRLETGVGGARVDAS